VSEVEVDEVLRFVRNEAAEVAPNNAVPGRSLALIESSLDMLSNVLLNRELGHRLLSNFDRLRLHILRHVRRLDLRLELLPSGRGGFGLYVRHVVFVFGSCARAVGIVETTA